MPLIHKYMFTIRKRKIHWLLKCQDDFIWGGTHLSLVISLSFALFFGGFRDSATNMRADVLCFSLSVYTFSQGRLPGISWLPFASGSGCSCLWRSHLSVAWTGARSCPPVSCHHCRLERTDRRKNGRRNKWVWWWEGKRFVSLPSLEASPNVGLALDMRGVVPSDKCLFGAMATWRPAQGTGLWSCFHTIEAEGSTCRAQETASQCCNHSSISPFVNPRRFFHLNLDGDLILSHPCHRKSLEPHLINYSRRRGIIRPRAPLTAHRQAAENDTFQINQVPILRSHGDIMALIKADSEGGGGASFMAEPWGRARERASRDRGGA